MSVDGHRFRWLAPVAIASVVGISLLASLRPATFLFIWELPGADKLGHFIEMGFLALALVLGLSPLVMRRLSLGIVPSLVLTLVLVTLDEILQIFAPSRTFSLVDLAWSYGGVLVFGLLGALLRRAFESAAAARARG